MSNANLQDNSASNRDAVPIYQFRPNVLRENISRFSNGFPGTIAYAVKANSDIRLLKVLLDNGISSFDTASIQEIRLLRNLSKQARLLYMNPVKTSESIHEAYFHHNVRSFALDSDWELDKILQATNHPDDLNLFLRIAVCDDGAKVALSSKFGIPLAEAPPLLIQTRKAASNLGVCFHVGSQCEDRNSFSKAIADVEQLISQVPFELDLLDVGGGFPAAYINQELDIELYFKEVKDALDAASFASVRELICEPGRALVANTESLLLRVLGRKGDCLYLNDGVFGGIFEPDDTFEFPVRLKRASQAPLQAFSFFGPTCDSTDKVKATFSLPGDIKIGDTIELGHMGAYSKSLRSDFNGFGTYKTEVIDDEIGY